MKASELITQLHALIASHGDREVVVCSYDGQTYRSSVDDAYFVDDDDGEKGFLIIDV